MRPSGWNGSPPSRKSRTAQLLLRPLLAQAGYAVEVAREPEAARLAAAFARTPSWRDPPLLGLGPAGLTPGARDEGELLAAVDERLGAAA